MTERETRVLRTVGALKAWNGGDERTRVTLDRLAEMGYVYRVARRPRVSAIPERPPSYRLTDSGRSLLGKQPAKKPASEERGRRRFAAVERPGKQLKRNPQ